MCACVWEGVVKWYRPGVCEVGYEGVWGMDVCVGRSGVLGALGDVGVCVSGWLWGLWGEGMSGLNPRNSRLS